MELTEQELAGDLPHGVHLEEGGGGQQDLHHVELYILIIKLI